MFAIAKAAYLNKLVQGGRLYLAFPLRKASLYNVNSVLLTVIFHPFTLPTNRCSPFREIARYLQLVHFNGFCQYSIVKIIQSLTAWWSPAAALVLLIAS
jgi:hypothetical protein